MTFSELFQQPISGIVLKALLAGIFISVCAAILGVTLVLKRYSMIGDGLSHVAFGAMTVATAANFAGMAVALPVTIAAAILILRANSGGKLKGDASIAMISVSSLAIGYLIMHIFSGQTANMAGDVCGTLFASTSILTLSTGDVVLCGALTLGVVICYVLFYNKFFAITFDQDFAASCGVRTGFYNTLLAILSAVVIVLAMKLVGALLISALIIFPALTAMRVFRGFLRVVVSSVVISVICTLFGILLSCLFSTPVGATIVVMDLVCYILFSVFARIRYGK